MADVPDGRSGFDFGEVIASMSGRMVRRFGHRAGRFPAAFVVITLLGNLLLDEARFKLRASFLGEVARPTSSLAVA